MRRALAFLFCLIGSASVMVAVAGPSAAVISPKKVTFFQGDLNAWVSSSTVAAVATNLAQADVLVMSHPRAHAEGSSWNNFANGAAGCLDTDNRANLISVLAAVKAAKPSIKVFGYVSAAADAPDMTNPTRQAHCGNCVNNLVTYNPCSSMFPPGAPYAAGWTNPTTTFTACPTGTCHNFIQWVGDWLQDPDTLKNYIDGIFIDYVAQTQIGSLVRDNLYSYVHAFPGKLVMANSLTPGNPCIPCGSVNNYQFAADSSYLNSTDYILVEGYYRAAGGDSSTATGEIAGIRNTMASAHSGIRPRIAALVTQNQSGPPATIACTDTDFLNAHSVFDSSSVADDAIGYAFSDYGTLQNPDGSLVHPFVYCA